MKMNKEVYMLLRSALVMYEGDCKGMADAGEMLESEFEDYIDYDKLSVVNAESTISVDRQVQRFKEFFDL
jgi:hypothetical protein